MRTRVNLPVNNASNSSSRSPVISETGCSSLTQLLRRCAVHKALRTACSPSTLVPEQKRMKLTLVVAMISSLDRTPMQSTYIPATRLRGKRKDWLSPEAPWKWYDLDTSTWARMSQRFPSYRDITHPTETLQRRFRRAGVCMFPMTKEGIRDQDRIVEFHGPSCQCLSRKGRRGCAVG